MPPNAPGASNIGPRIYAKQLVIAGGIALLLGVGAWLYFKNKNSLQTHADFYTTLVAENASFAGAERSAEEGHFGEALKFYDKALSQATNDEQRVQLTLLKARALTQTGAYADAVPLLKGIVASPASPSTSRARALAVVELADIASNGIPTLNREIFKDEPYLSMWTNDPALTLRKMHEYAASIFPVAIAELRVARWYASELPEPNAQPSTSSGTVSEYKARIAQLLSIADKDIAYMRGDGTMKYDLRYALLTRAKIVGILNRKKDMSQGNAEEQFAEAIAAYAEAGPGHDCYPRYYYALFLAQTFGKDRKADIEATLKPISGKAYSEIGGCSFLQGSKASAYDRYYIKSVARVDPDFKAYLLSIGWTAGDFSS